MSEVKLSKWDERFLEQAKIISEWSKDPSSKVGSIAVSSDRKILSTGYNGFPRKIEDSVDRLSNRSEKYKYVVHSEMNCIFNACYTGTSLNNSILYVYGLPVCSECAKGIIQSGVSKVISLPKEGLILDKWKESNLITIELFKESGVEYIYLGE